MSSVAVDEGGIGLGDEGGGKGERSSVLSGFWVGVWLHHALRCLASVSEAPLWFDYIHAT